MSVNTEPMNLKDAFAYMNFLSTSMQTARDLLSPVSPRLDVRTISSDNYLYTSRKVLRYSEVNSGMEDTQEDVEGSPQLQCDRRRAYPLPGRGAQGARKMCSCDLSGEAEASAQPRP